MISYISHLDKMTSHSISIKYIHIRTNAIEYVLCLRRPLHNFNIAIGMCALHETQFYRNYL